MDNAPDYAKCSLRELRDVAARINREQYLERYAAVLREIERREASGDAPPDVPKRALTLADIPNVLLTMSIFAFAGAVLGGSSFYVMFPPYISDYGDGVGPAALILFLAFVGAIIGSVFGAIRGVIKARES